MFAINHAAAALIFKKKYEDVSLAWLLVAVQASELLWVAFNVAGIERTVTADAVRTVGDIHLDSIPYSHSVASAIVQALILGVLARRFLRVPRAGLAVSLAVLSHIVLDLATHARDIVLVPFLPGPKLGLGLYGHHPLMAFFVELGFGVACWWFYRGSWWLLAAIVGFNLLDLPLFVGAIVGPKPFLAHRPDLVVGMVAVQIVVTLTVVGFLSRRRSSLRRGEAVVARAR